MRKCHVLMMFTLLATPLFSLNAQSVDLLWQGNSYTPPFYDGGTPWTSQSMITLVAIPHGISNTSNLFYKWTKNGTVLGNINGVGRTSIAFYDTIISRPQTIKVDVLSFDESEVLASASVFVTPTPPSLAVYENSPLYGFMFHRETSGTHVLIDREVTFTAFPLFFSALNRFDSSLNYEWLTNASAGTSENRNSVTYRTPDDASGISSVDVNVSNNTYVLQSGNKGFLVQFGNQ